MSAPTRQRILCIEDDIGTSELLVEVLEEEGFTVAVAKNGIDGLAGLRERTNLVLCDIDIPDLSGFELLERVRLEKLLPHSVPFIFITAHTQRKHELHARRLGCDDYITKPLDFELLVAIVRHRLAMAEEKGVDGPAFQLTDRELEALTWAARGKSSSDIAVILGVTDRTVNFHMDNIIRKTGVATRVQAAVKCAMLGLIRP